MKSHLGDYFRKVRLANGRSLGQLARKVGYRNVNKGCRRITTFETTGTIHPDLLTKVAAILEIDNEVIEQLLRNVSTGLRQLRYEISVAREL